jgi:hypothetical protein
MIRVALPRLVEADHSRRLVVLGRIHTITRSDTVLQHLVRHQRRGIHLL